MKLTSILGFAVTAGSLVLFVLARVQLGKSFSVTPKARGLVTHGLYSRIRNPMYVFLDLALLGIALATGSWYPLLPVAILLPLQVMNSRREARVLEEKFGVAYTDYSRGTWF